MAVHAALHNITEFDLRISVDFRFQLEGEALTDVCLHPHFQRITWEDVYRGWKSDQLPVLLEGPRLPGRALRGATGRPRVREGADESGFTPEDWVTILTVDKRWEARYQRRIERLAEVTGDPSLVDASATTEPSPPAAGDAGPAGRVRTDQAGRTGMRLRAAVRS